MRILKAYKEVANTSTVDNDYYEVAIAVKMNVAVTGPIRIFAFIHNKQRHVVACLRPTDDISSIQSLYTGENINIIVVAAKSIGGRYYIPECGTLVANRTSTTLVSNAVASNVNTFTLRSYTHSQAYLDFTYTIRHASYTNSLTRSVNTITETVAAITYGTPITLDIDEKTVFGITLQSFDFAKPTEPKTTVSNTFTLPKSINNDKLTNGVELLQDGSNQIYETWYIDYWVDAHRHIEKARLMVSGITYGNQEGRIFCVIYGKQSIWDRLQAITWRDFMGVYSVWLNSKITTEWSGFGAGVGFEAMVNALDGATDHICLPLFYGDFHRNTYETFLHSFRPEYEQDNGRPLIYTNELGMNGGHIAVYCKSIFLCLKETYGFDLMAAASKSIFDRAIEGATYIQTRHLAHVMTGVAGDVSETHSIVYNNGLRFNATSVEFDKQTKTVYNFVLDFIRQTNAILDQNVNGTFSLYSFEDINSAPVVDFTGMFTGAYEFVPMIDGIAQRNYVDFNKYSDLLPEGAFKRTITCNNKNIELEATLASVPCFVPPAFPYNTFQLLGFYEKKSFEEFTLLVNNSTTTPCDVCWDKIDAGVEFTTALYRAIFYGLDYSYNKYQSIISYPKFIKAKKWVSYEDVRDLKYFCLYHIKELGGTFFINKIAGLNPDASKQPTDIELVFVNYKLPTEWQPRNLKYLKPK